MSDAVQGDWETTLQGGLHLRPACADDSRLLWVWANDPLDRAASFSTEPIAWEVHQSWLARKLGDPSCRLFMVLDGNDVPIGQIRFELTGPETAEISIGLAPTSRGKGYGARAIEVGVREIVSSTSIENVVALIKPGNHESRRVFEKAGFEQVGEELAKGQPVVRYVRRRISPPESSPAPV
jgi:UDP-2,4-diacetamido-2,4,6-trideoxy-beta-L-altropyranose hydrolase